MTAPVEGQGRLLDDVVRRRCPCREEAGPHPLEEMVTRHVICRDDEHSLAAAAADPILRQRHGLGGARAGSVHVCVWSSGADQLRELRVAHREHTE